MSTRLGIFVAMVFLLVAATQSYSDDCFPDLPAPQLEVVDKEDYEANGMEWTRYRMNVVNWSDYPEELFEPAPDLPPCGLNDNASRTWVHIYKADGSYIYGFCAFSAPSNLTLLWFAVPQGTDPPEEVYITLRDRRCGIVYRSNLASTDLCNPDLPAPQVEVVGSEDYQANGSEWTRYQLNVVNWSDYPEELFEAAPDLPPCGLNTNASRTWVHIHEAGGSYIYGFCALSTPSNLQDIWFAVPKGTTPPDVIVILWDRQCDTRYFSNPVATTVPTEAVSWGQVKAIYR